MVEKTYGQALPALRRHQNPLGPGVVYGLPENPDPPGTPHRPTAGHPGHRPQFRFLHDGRANPAPGGLPGGQALQPFPPGKVHPAGPHRHRALVYPARRDSHHRGNPHPQLSAGHPRGQQLRGREDAGGLPARFLRPPLSDAPDFEQAGHGHHHVLAGRHRGSGQNRILLARTGRHPGAHRIDARRLLHRRGAEQRSRHRGQAPGQLHRKFRPPVQYR